MPVGTLFIEGKLDQELLYSVLLGDPVLKIGGSKSNLKTRARAECENHVAAGYLRDRDFDYDPPSEFSIPTLDNADPVGWRWCRHEIENYLIEPSLVSEATNCAILDIEQAICQAAKKIRSYEAARWTVGFVRRALPPAYKLKTRPENLKNKDIALPANADFRAFSTWAFDSIAAHRDRIADATDAKTVNKLLGDFIARFDDEFVTDVSNVLIWFSGKDIMAGLSDWLKTRNFKSATDFRSVMSNWVIENPE
ncbi:MAG: hypothetical protein WCK85_10865 [Chlorobium sp.]